MNFKPSSTSTKETQVTISPITPITASGPGALDGFKAVCSCGMVLKNSLASGIRHDVAAHAAYHARKSG